MQADDFVLMDLEGSSRGRADRGRPGQDYMAQVGRGTLIPGFEENLIGMRGRRARSSST